MKEDMCAEALLCAISVAKDQSSTEASFERRILPNRVSRSHLQVLRENRNGCGR